MNIQEMKIENLKEIREISKNGLTDNRIKKRSTFKLWDVLTTSILAVMANADTFEEIETFGHEKYNFLKSFLQLTGGLPTVRTYENIIGMLDPAQLQNMCREFVIKAATQNIKQDIISIDGKVDKSSSRKSNELHNEIKPLNVLNAYSNELGICLYGMQIDSKTNEIPMFKEIVKHINVKGNILTVDALNTQTENAAIVKKLKGEYVFAVKGNQGLLYDDLIDYFADKDLLKKCNSFKKASKENGNVVTRTYYQTGDIDWLLEKDKWVGLETIGCIKKEIINAYGEISTETRYYISSLGVNIELFAKAVRSHWGVENKLHWQLDFTFKCDYNTTENKSALFNLQIIKKLVLNILNLVKEHFKKSLIKIRYIISLNTEKTIIEIFKIVFDKYQENGFGIFDKPKTVANT